MCGRELHESIAPERVAYKPISRHVGESWPVMKSMQGTMFDSDVLSAGALKCVMHELTRCSRCRKKMKRVERLGTMDPAARGPHNISPPPAHERDPERITAAATLPARLPPAPELPRSSPLLASHHAHPPIATLGGSSTSVRATREARTRLSVASSSPRAALRRAAQPSTLR